MSDDLQSGLLYKKDGKLRTDNPTGVAIWLREELRFSFVEDSAVVVARLEQGGETITIYTTGIVVCSARLSTWLIGLVSDPTLLPTTTRWVRKKVVKRRRTRQPRAARTNALSVEVQGSKRYLTDADGQLKPLALAAIAAVKTGTHEFKDLCNKLTNEEGVSIATARLMLRMLLKAGILLRMHRGWYELTPRPSPPSDGAAELTIEAEDRGRFRGGRQALHGGVPSVPRRAGLHPLIGQDYKEGGNQVTHFIISSNREHEDYLDAAVAALERLLSEKGVALVTAYLNHGSYIDIDYREGKPYLKTCQSKPVRVADFRQPAKTVTEFVRAQAHQGVRFTITLVSDHIANDATYINDKSIEQRPLVPALLDYERWCADVRRSPFALLHLRAMYLQGWYDGHKGTNANRTWSKEETYDQGYRAGEAFTRQTRANVKVLATGQAPGPPVFGDLKDIERARGKR